MGEAEAATEFFRQHLEAANAVPGGSPAAWPAPQPLPPELPPVANLNPEYLPEGFRGMACDTADRMQVPLDFPAAVGVVALAGCVGRRAVIQPKRSDGSWVVTPNLWGGIVGPPGFMKSPALACVIRLLEAIESAWFQEH